MAASAARPVGHLPVAGTFRLVQQNLLQYVSAAHWPTLRCPSEAAYAYNNTGWSWTAYSHYYSRSSYHINQNIMRTKSDWNATTRGFSQIRVTTTAPDTAAILLDGGITVTNGNQNMSFEDEIDHPAYLATSLYNGQIYFYYAFRHRGRTNVAHLDGHVQGRQPFWDANSYIYRSIWVVNAGR